MKKHILFFLIFYNSYSQISYNQQWINAENSSLSQNSIKSIAKDKYDFIWLATENGIVRYDGENLITYKTNEPTIENRMSIFEGSIEKNYIYTFCEKRDNIITIKDRKVNFTTETKNKRTIQRIKKLFYLNNIKLNGQNYESEKYWFTINTNAKYSYQYGKLNYYEKKTLKHSINLKGYDKKRFFIKNNKLFYYFNYKKVIEFEKNGSYKIIDTNISNNNAHAKEDFIQNYTSNQAFFIKEKSIYLINHSNGKLKFELLFNDANTSNFKIISLLYDQKNDILYLGTLTNGLCIIKKQHIQTIKKNKNKSEYYYAFDQITNNAFLTSNGFFIEDFIIKDSLKLNNKDPYVILFHKGYFWSKQIDRVIKIDGNLKKTDSIFFNQEVQTISKGMNNKIWFSLKKTNILKAQIGYFSTENNNKFKSFYFDKNINSIFQLNDNDVLLAAQDNLYKFNFKKGTYILIKKNVNIRTILKVKSNFWFMTYGDGVYAYNNKEIKKLPIDSKNVILNAHSAIPDNLGYIWISTNNGLLQTSSKAIDDYLLNKSNTLNYAYYDIKDGLLTNEFNGGCNPSGQFIDNKYAVFPSMNGIVYINTTKIKPLFPENEIYADRINVDNKNKFIKDTIWLKRNFENLKIYIDCPNYGKKENLKLEYNLDNNKIWQQPIGNNTIILTSLSHGYHTITIRKQNGFENQFSYKKIWIYVKPAIWETIYFKVFSLLLTVLLLSALYRYRIHYIKKENEILSLKIEEKTNYLNEIIESLETTKEELNHQIENQKKLIRTITHDIKTPIKFISNSSKHIYLKENKINKESKEILKSIFESSFHLNNFIDNLLTYSNEFTSNEEYAIENINIKYLFDQKISLFKHIAELTDNIFINEVTNELYFEGNKSFIGIIIHNLIDNAIKNTTKGKIYLNAILSTKTITIIVSDTGNGMTIEKINLILSEDYNFLNNRNEVGVGFKLIKELLKNINGKIEIESEIGVGTTIRILLLLSN